MPNEPSVLERFAAPLLAVFGTVAVFHRELATGFAELQVSPLDPLLQSFVLEHLWRWATGAVDSFWSPPFFHPLPGGLAFGDPTFGALPFYAPLRALGLAPLLAYGLYPVLALLAAYLAYLALFRRGFALRPASAALAAFLVAYGAPRAASLNHPHLFLAWPTAFVLLAAFRVGKGDPPPLARKLWAFGLPLFAAVQAWSSLYLFALFIFWMAGSAIALALDRHGRAAMAAVPRGVWLAVGSGAAVAALLLVPLWSGLEGPRESLQLPSPAEVDHFQPRLASFVNPGSTSLLEGALGRRLEAGLPATAWAHRLGIGLGTTALALFGLRRAGANAPFRWLASGLVAIAALTVRWPGGSSAWPALLELFEPLASLRVISRIGLLCLIPAAVALAAGFERLAACGVRRGFLAAALAVVLLEQVQVQASFPRREEEVRLRELAATIPADCDSFFYSRYRPQLGRRGVGLSGLDHQTEHARASWAALLSGKPTLNGYASFAPAAWPIWSSHLTSESGIEDQRAALRGWIRDQRLEAARVCWVRLRVERMRVVGVEVERFGPSPQ